MRFLPLPFEFRMFGLTAQLQSVQFFPNRKISGFAFRKREREDGGNSGDEPSPKKAQAAEEEEAAGAFL